MMLCGGNCAKILSALSAISIIIVLAHSAIHLLHTDEVTTAIVDGEHRPRSRTLFEMPSLDLSPPALSMDNDYPYSVIIISYHKTGHDLQMDLVDYIVNEFPDIGPRLTEFGNKSPVKRRRHPAYIPCTRIGKHLQTGTITVQHAPDLFCTPDELVDILLDIGARKAVYDRGVKVIHLVRNPFSIAVSNYHYHAQIPTPEPWVKDQNPCDIEWHEGDITDTFADMVLPTLSKAKYDSLKLKFKGQFMSRGDFDAIRNDCLSLYQTRGELKNASFLTHLMNYDPPEGLRLATAEMMIQGFGNGGDILRMANNIIKLKQAQIKLNNNPKYQASNRGLHIYTMSLDDFIAQPGFSALKFFNFVLESLPVPQIRKEEAARRYWQHYQDKKINKSNHITHNRSGDDVMLTEYLRQDTVFGPSLIKIELLVEAALMEGKS